MQGYLVGNPVTDNVFDGNALVPFAHGMGLISDELFEVKTIVCANSKLHLVCLVCWILKTSYQFAHK